jgi:tRNA 2-selenouridine synthase SelU
MKRKIGYKELNKEILKIFRKKRKKRFLLLIGGCSRSGKNTLANRLIKESRK